MRKPRKSSKYTAASFTGTDPALMGASYPLDNVSLMKAYNYYSYTFDVKNARKWITEYMKKSGWNKKEISKFSDVPSNFIPMAVCAESRMISQGVLLNKEILNNRISALISKYSKDPEPTEEKVSVAESNTYIASIEDILDTFYRGNYKFFESDIYKFLQSQSAKQKDAKSIVEYYTPILEEVANNSLKEEFDHLTKTQRTSYIKFLSSIIEEAKQFATTEKTVNKIRKPRKKKIKTASQITNKVKFKERDDTLKIASQNPAEIVGSSAVWLYNTKYKKLTYLVAQPSCTLTIKGTTVQFFDEKLSESRTLRKPAEFLNAFMKATKSAGTKSFKNLTTKPAKPNGRINTDTVILKTVK